MATSETAPPLVGSLTIRDTDCLFTENTTVQGQTSLPVSGAADDSTSRILSTTAPKPADKTYIQLETNSSTPIYLTTFYPRDIETLPDMLSLPALSRDLIAIPHPYTRANAEWWVNLQLSGKGNLPLQVLRASDPVSGTMIGAVSLEPHHSKGAKDGPNMKDTECKLGYYLRPDWQGKNIMIPAAKALLRWAKEEVGVGNVMAQVAEENSRSRAVVSRLGDMFERSEEFDTWVDWPEQKVGGRRRLLAWIWTGKLDYGDTNFVEEAGVGRDGETAETDERAGKVESIKTLTDIPER